MTDEQITTNEVQRERLERVKDFLEGTPVLENAGEETVERFLENHGFSTKGVGRYLSLEKAGGSTIWAYNDDTIADAVGSLNDSDTTRDDAEIIDLDTEETLGASLGVSRVYDSKGATLWPTPESTGPTNCRMCGLPACRVGVCAQCFVGSVALDLGFKGVLELAEHAAKGTLEEAKVQEETLEATAAAQTAYWDALSALEAATELTLDDVGDLAGMTVEDLREQFADADEETLEENTERRTVDLLINGDPRHNRERKKKAKK